MGGRLRLGSVNTQRGATKNCRCGGRWRCDTRCADPRRRCRPSNAFRDHCIPSMPMRMPGGIRMSEAPVQLLVAAFTEEDAADKVFEQLKQAKKEKLIHIQDVAVIKRDADSKIHINEPRDWKAGKGAGVGAVIGAALGIITGPGVVLTTAAGAAIGGLAAQLRDAGFPDDQLTQVGEAL